MTAQIALPKWSSVDGGGDASIRADVDFILVNRVKSVNEKDSDTPRFSPQNTAHNNCPAPQLDAFAIPKSLSSYLRPN
ncbi:hypothetical protein K239x_01310 [Planctomycetes bacterium K23_9]|uniref:Uncharacterized protein n=1 Tax=Stieleria marina TaxID=1930275 RepID=A0A517NM49_9BACT|nr:hypothetical protein K239x_01310 [Planctomycetes bacterium K23_9]